MKRLAHYSQYFLRDPDFIRELVGHSSIRKSDTVYDIGAGSGAISAVLAQRARDVISIELEPRMAQKLRENMKRYYNVTVIEQDILSVVFPDRPFKVFANIPFHLSSDIVRKLVFDAHSPQSAYLIVQRQFAKKLLIEKTPFTGQLGAVIAPWVSVRIRRPLRRTDFWPHPNVDTVLIELKQRADPLVKETDEKKYVDMVTNAYHDPVFFKRLPLERAHIDPTLRPSQLSLAQWLLLFDEWRVRRS